MYSLAFLSKLKKIAQSDAQTALAADEAAISASSDPTTAAGAGKRSTGSRRPMWAGVSPGDVQTIVYDPITGKAYPNPSEARGAGVTNFTYNIPSGMNIDWSWWDKFKQPATTTPAPVPITVAPQEIAYSDPVTDPPKAPSGDDGGQTNAPTQPPGTTPAVTTPAVTTPAVTTPAATTVAVTTPAATTPAATTQWVRQDERDDAGDNSSSSGGNSTWQGEGDYGDDTSAEEQGGNQGGSSGSSGGSRMGGGRGRGW